MIYMYLTDEAQSGKTAVAPTSQVLMFKLYKNSSPSFSSTARQPMHVLFFLVNLAIIPNPPEEVTTVLERVWLPSGRGRKGGSRGKGREGGGREGGGREGGKYEGRNDER